MRTTLSNGRLTVTADTRGAELQSIVKEGGLSYLWTGDPAYWSGRAPILFPFVGALRDKRAWSAGGEISLPQHGFARRSEWTVEEAGDTAVTYRLTAGEETRRGYPYDFELWVRYELEGDSVSTRFIVRNTGEQPLPYAIGGHPGFRVPLEEGETLEDYTVEFPGPETADLPQVDMSTGLIVDTVRNRFLTNRASFALNHVLFRGDALIFDRLNARSVKMLSRKSGHGVSMDFPDFPILGIWSPAKDAPFICLEPWTGMGTRVSEDDVFEHKIGVISLEPGGVREYAFTVTVF